MSIVVGGLSFYWLFPRPICYLPILHKLAGSKFDSHDKLCADFVPTRNHVLKFSSHFVRIDDDKKWFDWDGFRNAIVKYRGPYLWTARVGMLPDDSLARDLMKNKDVEIGRMSSRDDDPFFPLTPPVGNILSRDENLIKASSISQAFLHSQTRSRAESKSPFKALFKFVGWAVSRVEPKTPCQLGRAIRRPASSTWTLS
jgi:hypothetical protein